MAQFPSIAFRERFRASDGRHRFRMRIPMMPATYSDAKPATHSEFIPATIPA
ncbi:hypothetical protein GOD41_08475 [Sinorhizobium medicae]|nr:hypothetical protein [Sinorhizobium medicae]